MYRLFFVLIIITSGCGYLDDDLLLSDDSYEDSFEGESIGFGGLGLSGTGYGCGGGWGYHHSSWHHSSRVYIRVQRPADAPLATVDEWRAVPTPLVEGYVGVGKDKDEEKPTVIDEIEQEKQLFAAADAYLAAGYEVRIVSADEETEFNSQEAQRGGVPVDSPAL